MTTVALTFDDGPSEWTPAVLEILAAHGARATFFLIGEWVAERPDVVRATVSGGHEVGNHTYTHIPKGSLLDLTDEEVEDELTRTSDELERVTGTRPRLFRAPAFKRDARVLRVVERLGLVDVGATVDPEDWRAERSADEIVDHVLDRVEPGAVVDLHDGFPPYWGKARRDCTPTVDALRLLVPELARRSYEFVTVSEYAT